MVRAGNGDLYNRKRAAVNNHRNCLHTIAVTIPKENRLA